jgi:hypothetical protein
MANIWATEMKGLKPICVDNEARVGIGYRRFGYYACMWKVSMDSRAVRESRNVRQTSLVKKLRDSSSNGPRAKDPLCDFWVTAVSSHRGEADRAWS